MPGRGPRGSRCGAGGGRGRRGGPLKNNSNNNR